MTTTAPAPQPSSAPPARRPQGVAPSSSAPAFAALDPMKLLQQYYPWLIGASILGLLIGLASFFVLRRFLPRWDAEVVFEVMPQANDPSQPIGAGAVGDRNEMEAQMNTFVRVMQSDIILSRAVNERVVRDTRWANDYKDKSGNMDTVEALKELRDIVVARAIPDTKIIMLRVGTPHKDDAPNIANAIADVFLNDNETRSNRDMRNLIQQFEEVNSSLSKDLQRLEQQQQNILDSNKLTSLRQESTVEQQQVQNLQPAIVRMNEDKIMAEKQLERYEQMFNNPGGPVIPESIRDKTEQNPLVMQQDQGLQGIKAAIRSQKGEFGENHPEVKRLERRLAAQQQERDDLVERLMADEFSTAIESLRNQTRNMTASLGESEERLRNADRRLQAITSAIKQHEDMTLEYSNKMAKKAELEKRIDDMKLMLARGTRVRMLSQAQIPDTLAFPKIIPTTAVGIIGIVGLVGGLIALREIREQRVRGPQDVALIPRTRVLGIVPDLGMDPSSPEKVELAVVARPHGIISESIRQIRHTIGKEIHGKGLRTVMVVSGLPGSGATSLLTNLAANAAATDVRVLIIDANLRRPAVHSVMGTVDAPGVSDILLGSATFSQCVQASKVSNISVLPCGRREKPVFERFASPAMSAMLAEAKSAFDLVLVDSAPGVVSGDAIALAGHCDAVVLVVKAFSEKRGLVARLRNQLGETSAEFLGVVVNGVQASAGGYFKRNFQVSHEYGREASSDDTSGNGKGQKNGKGKGNPPAEAESNGQAKA